MRLKDVIKKTWNFLQEDSWQSWVVSIILIIILVRGVFFPVISWTTGTKMPLVIVESCSMYHEDNFDEWWNNNSPWYEARGITKNKFKSFSLYNGLNKGDIVFAWGKGEFHQGDIIIFNAQTQHPLIHRIIMEKPIATKGDHNKDQLTRANNVNSIDETNISKNDIYGKAVLRIPYLGWIKLIFFEPFRSQDQRGFCH